MPLFIFLLGEKFIPEFNNTSVILRKVLIKLAVFLISLLLGVFMANKNQKYAENARKAKFKFNLTYNKITFN